MISASGGVASRAQTRSSACPVACRSVWVARYRGLAARLSALAERTHVQEGTLARSLLSSALEAADPDPQYITDLLDSIPGAFERYQESRAQTREGKVIALDDR